MIPTCTCGVLGMCWRLGKTYVCDCCGYEVPWCFGASDDMPGACDDCWAAAHAGDAP